MSQPRTQMYCYAPTFCQPRSLPLHWFGADLETLNDAQRAQLGWVLDTPPPHNPLLHFVNREFSRDPDGNWSVAYELELRPLEQLKAHARAILASRRWQAESAGLLVEFGDDDVEHLHTDPASQAKLQSAVYGVDRALRPESAIWKFAGGPRTVSNAVIVVMVEASFGYVQSCYEREAVIFDLIGDAVDADHLFATMAAELDTGWPARRLNVSAE